MLLLLLVNSFLDVFGLAALVPVIMVAAEPGGVFKNRYFSFVYNLLNFSSERSFLVLRICDIYLSFLFKNAFST